MEFWDDRINYDAIIGKRPIRGDGKNRKFVEDIVCLMLKIIFGIKVEDANAPFRLMKSSLLAKYIDRLPVDYSIKFSKIIKIGWKSLIEFLEFKKEMKPPVSC